MVRTTFSGREIVTVLRSVGYIPVSREGSHVRLRDEHPQTGEGRTVDVQQHSEVRIGTLRPIADQYGPGDFEAWWARIDAHS